MNKIKSFFLVFIIGLLCVCGQAFGQLDTVDLEVRPDDVGVGGVIRRGTWAPMRVTLTSNAADPRTVVCRWRYADADGDTVIAAREVTLQAQVRQSVWLYANPPMSMKKNERLVVEVVDKESGRQLNRVEQIARTVLSPQANVIGVMGTGSGMGLNAYRGTDGFSSLGPGERSPYITQHEYVFQLRDMRFDRLPDRWFGLSMFETIIWNSKGGSPSESRVNDAMLMALREWVERGGHLVVMLPPAGQQWTSSSLGDMLPVTNSQLRMMTAKPPAHIVGRPTGRYLVSDIQMLALDVDTTDKSIAVLAKDEKQNPLIVSKAYGFGRVTVSGIDMNSPALMSMGLPGPRMYPIWREILGWQSPTYSRKMIDDEIKEGKINDRPNPADLSKFIPSVVTMRNTTGPALLLALLVFAVYWVVAGPVSFFALKAKKKHKYSWLIFTGIIGLFIAVSWGGAYMMRPTDAQISHFSVVDLNTKTGESHAHSWMSLYLPTFGDVKVDLAPDQTIDVNRNTLSAPGIEVYENESTFLDPQSYEVKASSPHVATIPFRSTTKTLEADYVGDLVEDQSGLAESWPMPSAQLSVDTVGFPTGTMKSNFKFPLRDVLFIYAPGDGGMPLAWRLNKSDKKWFPGETIVLDSRRAWPLVKRAVDVKYEKRSFQMEGFLGTLMHARRNDGNMFNTNMGQPNNVQTTFTDDRMTQMIEMMSFYSMLPPPDFRTKQGSKTVFQRPMGRQFDITNWLSQKRMIVIGYADDVTLPLPLTVDGEIIPSKGMVVVRWSHLID